MRDRVKDVMARIFGVPAHNLSDHASINEVPEWDSLRHLELMLELETEFAVSIPTMTMLELFSLHAIEEYLQREVAEISKDGASAPI